MTETVVSQGDRKLTLHVVGKEPGSFAELAFDQKGHYPVPAGFNFADEGSAAITTLHAVLFSGDHAGLEGYIGDPAVFFEQQYGLQFADIHSNKIQVTADETKISMKLTLLVDYALLSGLGRQMMKQAEIVEEASKWVSETFGIKFQDESLFRKQNWVLQFLMK